MNKKLTIKRSAVASASVFVLLSVLGSGCDMFAMPDKMDDMNKKMEDMNKGVVETNTTSSALLEAVRKQELATDLQDMFDAKNTEYTFPIPADMMAFGDDFAGAMHEDEFVKLVYLDMKDINEITPDPSLQNADGTWPAALAASTDHDKFIKYNAIEIISGFASDDMIAQMIDTEQTQGGEYGDDTVFTILEARSDFISSVLWEQKLNSAKIDNPGKIKAGIALATSLDAITTLPFASQIQTQFYGMLVPTDNQTTKLDMQCGTKIWKKLNQALSTDLLPAYKSALIDPSNAAGDELRSMQAEIQARLATP